MAQSLLIFILLFTESAWSGLHARIMREKSSLSLECLEDQCFLKKAPAGSELKIEKKTAEKILMSYGHLLQSHCSGLPSTRPSPFHWDIEAPSYKGSGVMPMTRTSQSRLCLNVFLGLESELVGLMK